MEARLIQWATTAIQPLGSTTTNQMSLLMDWRRHLFQSTFDKSPLAQQLRQSDENNSVRDVVCADCCDELKDGTVMALLSFWMYHARSENVLGGSTWLHIRSININGCNLEHTICELFFKGLSQTTPSLTDLNVSANQIGGYSDEDDFFIPVLSPGNALIALMKTNESITSLKASYCNMGMNTITGLSNALAYHNRTLNYLDVSANSMWWDEINVDELDSDRCFDRTAMYEIAAMMLRNHCLTHVKVSAVEFKPWRLCGRCLFTPSATEIEEVGDVVVPDTLDEERKHVDTTTTTKKARKKKKPAAIKEDKRDNLQKISFGKGGNMGKRASRSDLVITMECLLVNTSITSLTVNGLRLDHEGKQQF